MITRDVAPASIADLALAPPRCALAAVVDDELVLLPVRARLDGTDAESDPRIVEVPVECPDLTGRDVVLVCDDGPQWFRLRSLTVRATASALDEHTYRLTPRRVVAWDYGSLRDDPTAGPPSPRPPVNLSATTDLLRPVVTPSLRGALDRSRVMIMATRSARGMAFAVPLWFVAHRGHIYAATSASAWTVRNVVASAEVALLLGGERGEADRVLVRGPAHARAGVAPPPVLARIASRYYLSPRFAVDELRHLRLWPTRMRYYRQAHPAYVVVSPQSAAEIVAPQ